MTPGSSCIANAYTNNHDLIVSPETGTVKGIALHAVDALAIVHALLLRLQTLLLAFKTLVFSGHQCERLQEFVMTIEEIETIHAIGPV